MPQPPMKRSPATALIAYAQALSLQDPVPPASLEELMETVCSDRAERVALLTAMSKANDPSTRVIVADLFRSYAADCVEKSEGYENRDSTFGVWTQRLGAGLFVFCLGTIVAGTATGLLGAAAIAAPLCLVGAAAYGRLHLLKRKRRNRKIADLAESLAKSIGDIQ